MARPTTFDEITNNNLYNYTISKEKSLGEIDLQEMITNPNLMKAWSDFVKALQHNGFEVVPSGYSGAGVKFVRELNEEEKAEQLTYAQNRWDSLKNTWEACDASNGQPEDYRLNDVKKWAEQEGKDIPWEREEFERA